MAIKVDKILNKIRELDSVAGPAGAGITNITYNLDGTLTITYGSTGDTVITGDLHGLDGDDGSEIELQTSATHIQRRYVGDVSRTNLVLLSDLKGISFTPKGAYSAGTAYVPNDVVSYLGSSWIALQNTTGNTPSEGDYWTLNAAKGTDGEGDVMGPATNTDSYIPQRDGTNSKTLKDGLAVPAGGFAGLTALGGKVDANAAITGATKTKITYDAKGLITAGADATTADIADSSNKRYVTDAEKIVIGNTSGTNTGDNATNTQYSGLATSKQDTLVSGTNIKTINSTSILGSGNIEVTGGLSWVAKTTTYTAAVGEGILADTSGGAWSLTLPITPTVGDEIGVSDSTSSFATNNLTILRNGSKIHGLTEDLVVNIKDASFKLIYTGVTTGWKLDTYLEFGIDAFPKATGSDIDTGTDDAKFVTSKAIADSKLSYTDGTETLTNKRINPRVVSAASYTTDTGTSLNIANCDIFVVTAQAGALKLNNPGGTPTQGQKLIVRIKDNGTARALTYDTQFRAMGVALPTTTVLSKTLYMGFIYNATDTKRDLLAVGQEA